MKHNKNMQLWQSELDDSDEIGMAYWVEKTRNDFIFKQIIDTPAFERLYDISFLGAIDYTFKNKLSKENRNRATHSIYVASLANYIATNRNYDDDLRINIVVAALLHDIGHLPLSHSAEPYVKKMFGYGHHECGEKIINGEVKIANELKLILNKYCCSSFIKSLLNNNISYIDGGDLFSNKINIDTIDGILRCLEYKSNNNLNINRMKIAKAAFLDLTNENSSFNELDTFWKGKDWIYSSFINTDIGIISDKFSQLFFEDENNVEITIDDMFSNESIWKRKYSRMFNIFKKIKNNEIPECILSQKFDITSRKYTVHPDEYKFSDRYSYTKLSKSIEINIAPTDNNNVQLNLELMLNYEGR
ncbi:HD domain-containing protein [Pragia fontium]|uniref:HD/PDEase domain-containing protein n=1 Tax=Pragia fontium DSM 5563 = ATCC 49100 TaxID=1122977 RepID=A0AAJ5BFX0_9GAMM|nr:HD domain-containing protein [Pragia fontium]SFC07599.1 hypothetical protein SAMN02745723_101321 [Pragia fontium DSM 5563 = ATCC 49100]